MYVGVPVWFGMPEGLLSGNREMCKMNSQNLNAGDSPANFLNEGLGWMCGVYKVVRHGDKE